MYAEDSTRIYLSDASNRQLMLFDHGTMTARIVGTTGAGHLVKPMGLGGDRQGHVYVTDQTARRVVVRPQET